MYTNIPFRHQHSRVNLLLLSVIGSVPSKLSVVADAGRPDGPYPQQNCVWDMSGMPVWGIEPTCCHSDAIDPLELEVNLQLKNNHKVKLYECCISTYNAVPLYPVQFHVCLGFACSAPRKHPLVYLCMYLPTIYSPVGPFSGRRVVLTVARIRSHCARLYPWWHNHPVTWKNPITSVARPVGMPHYNVASPYTRRDHGS